MVPSMSMTTASAAYRPALALLTGARQQGVQSGEVPGDGVAGEVADPAVLPLEEPDRAELRARPHVEPVCRPGRYRQQVAAISHTTA